MPRGEFDPTLKFMVEAGPQDWLVLDGRPLAPVRIIDADLATVAGAADKVLRVDAAEAYLFHLEFHAGHDGADLPKKLNARNALLKNRHGLLVRSVAVILRPDGDSPMITGKYEKQFTGEEPYRVFRYDVIRVWQLPVDKLLKGGLATMPLAVVAAVAQDELPGVIGRMRDRLKKRSARRLAKELWTATSILLGMRCSAEMVQTLLQGVMTMRESSVIQAALAEGRAEQRCEESRSIVLLIGENHLGPASARVRKRIAEMTDLDRLRALCLKAPQAKDWQDLLADEPPAAPAPRRSGRRKNGTQP